MAFSAPISQNLCYANFREISAMPNVYCAVFVKPVLHRFCEIYAPAIFFETFTRPISRNVYCVDFVNLCPHKFFAKFLLGLFREMYAT
jgi:hypothetical protein